MGKIGTWEYPDLRVESALQIVEVLDTQFKGKANNTDAFAQALGHDTANSGAFYYKVADLRKYGLITPRGDIELTPLGDRIAHPNTPQERHEAIKEMVNNIAFFKKLNEALGNKPADANLHITLQDKFNIERKDAQQNAPKIRNIYNKILPYLSKDGERQQEQADNMDNLPIKDKMPNTFTQGSQNAVQTFQSNFTYTSTPDLFTLRFEPTTLHVAMAENVLKELKEQINQKKKQKDETQN